MQWREIIGPRYDRAYSGADNEKAPPQPRQAIPDEFGLDRFKSASQTGEIVIQCECGVRRLQDIERCPGCGKKDVQISSGVGSVSSADSPQVSVSGTPKTGSDSDRKRETSPSLPWLRRLVVLVRRFL